MRIWHACVRLVCAFLAWTAKVPRAEKGYGKGFQAGGPTGPYPVGEVGPRSLQPASPTHQEQPSMPGSPGPQGPLFTPDQLTQIAQIFRMGIETVVREMSTRLDGLQAQ